MKPSLLSLALLLSALSSPSYSANFCSNANKWEARSIEAARNEGKYTLADSRRERTMEYLGCRYDIQWMQEVRRSLCSGTKDIDRLKSVKLPKMNFFLIDGFLDFNGSKGHSIGAVNLDGSEGNDLGVGKSAGLNTVIRELEDNTSVLSNNWDDIQFHYHGGSGFYNRESYSSGIACAVQMEDYYKELDKHNISYEKPKMFVMGFSNGGMMALNFQKEMSLHQIPVDLAFIIDPIEQALFFLAGKFKDTRGEKAELTKRLINFYQLTDDKIIPFTGRPVKGADINLLVNSDNSSAMDKDGRKDHTNILKSHFVRDVLNKELSTLLE